MKILGTLYPAGSSKAVICSAAVFDSKLMLSHGDGKQESYDFASVVLGEPVLGQSQEITFSDGSRFLPKDVKFRWPTKRKRLKLIEKLEQNLFAVLEAVVQNQDNREHDILDSDDYYQFQGGMTNAVTQFRGQAPSVYHNDHSNPSSPKIRTLKEELNRVVRSRVLNPKWIQAMQEHGYKGAFEMTATVDYLFAYDATTDLVADYQYEQVTQQLLLDPDNQAFMRDNNPHALEEMAERLLEAIQRGMWQDDNGCEAEIQSLLLDLDQQQEQKR